MKPQKKFLYFLEQSCSYILGNRKPGKTFYIPGDGNPTKPS